MKFQQLKRKSIPAGQDLRVRLARLEDQDFVERMNAEAGAQRPSDRVTHPLYQSGIHAALDQPGGYFKRVAASYNATVEQDLGQALMNAIDTASFDLVAVKDGERVGMVSIGASYQLVFSLLDTLGPEGQHQALSLIMGLPKLVSLTVETHERGRGHGSALLETTQAIVKRMGCVGIFGECEDQESLLRFYESCGMTVLDAGQHLNVFPVAGTHVATGRPGDPRQGPFVAAEQGFRIFYGLGGHRGKNASEDMLAQLNGPSHGQQ
jgi:GNAT superfamily N-acetyltransferase